MDAKRLLEQMMGTGRGMLDKSGYAGQEKGLATGALAGGLAGLLLGNKKARKYGGSAAKYGALAAIAGVAWKAWQANQASSASQSGQSGGQGYGQAGAAPQQTGAWGVPSSRETPVLPPPTDSPFAPQRAPQGEDNLARSLIIAMIAAAKADGHVDAEEQRRIFDRLDEMELDSEEKAFVMDELRAPLDIDRIVRLAKTPEQGAEIYAASLLAMEPDHPAERAFLDMLAARLNLDKGLVHEIEEAANGVLV
ncbi:tellurite resistance TerB family protein [Methylobrevis pamukkalensis]|uniref:Inner membrane protein YebE n=1 Tax=Methylobrevis pamukkalensis TaxID=1439726 RepID=A0A1E3H397_9HYPH|nr:tellurite resistance TerB family protein [Methylobrevis pamukkalensis]ODN70780.1 Inner membrane protein YebE [Methylobrevis pamukkalensis]